MTIDTDLPSLEITPPLNVEEFLFQLVPHIESFFSNPRLPVWTPPSDVDDATKRFYSDLAIPFVNGKPNLLLHNLLNNPSPNLNGNKMFHNAPLR
jgi:hypothetical protein